MPHPRYDPRVRNQVLLAGIGAFLVAYLVGLGMGRPFEWVAAISTVALVVTIGAGLLVAEVVAISGGGQRGGQDQQRNGQAAGARDE
jgi:hypothetical protein